MYNGSYKPMMIGTRIVYSFSISLKNEDNHRVYQLASNFRSAVNALSDYIVATGIDAEQIAFCTTSVVPCRAGLITSIGRTTVYNKVGRDGKKI